MADSNTIMSVVATTASRLPDLSIKNGQLIFIKDKQKIALDLDDKRIFYNQIVVLQTETERASLLAPISGLFYFVIESAVLWTYQTGWIQITTPPEDIVFIGTSLPELGSNKTLYVDTENKNIQIWNSGSSKYDIVADYTEAISTEEIENIFLKRCNNG